MPGSHFVSSRHALTLIALFAGLLAVNAPPASAAGTIDQAQESGGGLSSNTRGDIHNGQTFTAGISGSLVQVDLGISVECVRGNDLTVQIQNVTGAVPNGQVLATTAVSESSIPVQGWATDWVSVSFSPAATVAAGTKYAIVISTPEANDCPDPYAPPDFSSDFGFPYAYHWSGAGWSGNDLYPGGGVVESGDGGANWGAFDGDFMFRTYVGDAAPPDTDTDGIPDSSDNCPSVANPGQADLDGDTIGDACDDDTDGDGVLNASDRCSTLVGDASRYGCPSITRTLSLGLNSAGKLAGTLSASAPRCVRNQAISILSRPRKSSPSDFTVIATVQTTNGGHYSYGPITADGSHIYRARTTKKIINNVGQCEAAIAAAIRP